MPTVKNITNIQSNLEKFLHCGAIYRKSKANGIFQVDFIQWDYNQPFESPLIYRSCRIKFKNYTLTVDEDINFENEGDKIKYIQKGIYPNDLIDIHILNENHLFRFDFIGFSYQISLHTRELPSLQVKKYSPSITLEDFRENVVLRN